MVTRSLPERVGTLEEAVSALQHLPQELAEFRAQVVGRFERIDTQFGRVYSQMRMVHEDLVDRIKALGEGRDTGATTPPRPRRPKRKR